MALQSRWFQGNARLQLCLTSDPAHVTAGDKGDHVSLIQGALTTLDLASLSATELAQQVYGPSTAGAVLKYKQKRRIINPSYQTSADNIVGRMTIQALDTEMLVLERLRFRPLLAFNIAPPPAPIKAVIISQTHPLPSAWANQMVQAHKPLVVKHASPANGTPEQILASMKRAITIANGGLIIFSVGHGIAPSGFAASGGFDIADHAKMRIGGLGANRDPKSFVDVFYADKPPANATIKFSEKELDERTHPPGAARRLKNFKIYEELSAAFVAGKLAAVVILTCNIGKSREFLQKVSTQWKTPIIAYTDFVAYQGGFPGKPARVRAVLNRDVNKQNTPNPGTNIPLAETIIPLSIPDMVLIFP